MVSAVIILWFAIGLLRMIFARRIATFEDYNLFDFRGTFYTTQLLASVAVALFPERLASVLPVRAAKHRCHAWVNVAGADGLGP